jgi:hypothetical protein
MIFARPFIVLANSAGKRWLVDSTLPEGAPQLDSALVSLRGVGLELMEKNSS